MFEFLVFCLEFQIIRFVISCTFVLLYARAMGCGAVEANGLFVLLLSTLVCCQDLGFFIS